MPRDVQELVRQRHPELADRIIKDIYLYFVPDWSEATRAEIKQIIDRTATLIQEQT